MKKIIFAVMLLIVTSHCFSEIVGLKFKPEEFDDKKYVIRFSSTEMDMLEVKQLNSQTYNYAFKSKENDYEIRYILFSQTEDIPDFETYKMQVSLWSMMVLNNITGDEVKAQNTSAFKEEDVKKEFNADYGFTNFSADVQTDYSEGYKYMMINFFCKKGLGIMCQTILFNDLPWVETENFLTWFHGFNFY